MNTVPIRRALLSVFDKTGIEDFARNLVDRGVEIISSGGTARAIEAANIPVRRVEEWTGFPEMLGHRVVTLHPKVHGALLALRDDPAHQADIEKHDIELVDLVCVSLYPFTDVIAKPDVDNEEAIEMIDIGGPTMVRAAAKNHRYVTILTSPQEYDTVLAEMDAHDGGTTFPMRQALARKAFSLTASYDTAISQYLCKQTGEQFPERISFSYERIEHELRYGENPHQAGAFYVSSEAAVEPCIGRAKLITTGAGDSAKASVSFNNYFDANGAIELVKEFDQPAVAIIKHANPAGCAVDTDLVTAYKKAYFGDPNAAMGGIVAVNRPVTVELAEAIMWTYRDYGKQAGAMGFYAEIIAAPSFEPGAVECIRGTDKRWASEVRLLEVGPMTGEKNTEFAQKYVTGGMLVQQRDRLGLNTDQWSVATDRQPTEREMRDLEFSWLVCKHVKSNAIVLAKDLALLGAGAGQMSRVNSAQLASQLATQYGGGGVVDLGGCVLASDAFFPFADSLDWAKQAGATAVIQPGGANKDADVIAYANELDLAMVLTGTRHFNH